MKIENLKQVKDVLCKIPDELLETLVFGMGEGAEEDISILSTGTNGDDNYFEVFEKVKKLCPEYKDVVVYIKNIGLAQSILDAQDDNSQELSERCYENGESVTSEFFIEDTKSSYSNKLSEEKQQNKR